MSELTLHDNALDEGAYKVRLLASFLGLDLTLQAVNTFPGGEHKAPEFLALSPTGRLPVLRDGDFVLPGAEPVLAYLANTYHPGRQWLPLEPQAFGEVQRWLAFATIELEPASVARQSALFGDAIDERAASAARTALRIMDDHMVRRGFEGLDWFATEHATIADVALFPSFALSRDFGVDHDEYPALRRWGRRFRAIDGFKTMPGIPDYH
jgi:glutathione S-transferase